MIDGCVTPVVGVGLDLDVEPTVRLTNLYGPVPISASDRSSVASADAGIIFSQYMRAGSTPSGVGGRDVHGGVVDLLGTGEGAVEAVVVGLAVGDELDDAVDGGDDRVGVERRAVVERDAFAELELPGRVVDLGRQLGGEAGLQLARRRRGPAASRRCCR